jgi:superfamily II DNA helicase RecQ
LQMQVPTSSLLPAVILLVAPTGGGKSLVWDVVAAASPGVTLSISPLLALGADQESNLNVGIYDDVAPLLPFMWTRS